MEVPRHWRLRKQRYSLEGEVCLKCQTLIFPPRAVCPFCGGEASIPAREHNHETHPVQAFALKEELVKA